MYKSFNSTTIWGILPWRNYSHIFMIGRHQICKHVSLEIKRKKKKVCFFFFNSFVCSLHSKNVGVNLKKKKITLGCCITLANVVTFAVSPSCAPCCSLNSSGSLERVGKLVKRMMLVHVASFMAWIVQFLIFISKFN